MLLKDSLMNNIMKLILVVINIKLMKYLFTFIDIVLLFTCKAYTFLNIL